MLILMFFLPLPEIPEHSPQVEQLETLNSLDAGHWTPVEVSSGSTQTKARHPVIDAASLSEWAEAMK
jgi:hypothetical protein